jgi:hypothetical protein
MTVNTDATTPAVLAVPLPIPVHLKNPVMTL